MIRGHLALLQRNIQIHYNPILFFATCLLANILLSYFSLPLTAKLWIGVAGIGLPGMLFLLAEKPAGLRDATPYEKELFPSLPSWVLAVVALLAIVPRVFRLTSLSLWPFTDEGYFSFYSIDLLRRWDWKFFFALGQHPPAFNWAFALFFKLFTPSLQSLWLFPALLSALTVWAVFSGFKDYFPRSFVFFGIMFLGFGFWPLYSGRICQPTSAMLLAQVSGLASLAAYSRAGQIRERRRWAWACGAMAGFGFYVAIAWPLVFLSMVSVFLYRHWRGPKDEGSLWRFFTSFLLVAAPFFVESLLQKNGEYINELWAFYPGMNLEQQCMDFCSHLQALFWGISWRRLYGPVWGGLLNPVSGALLFTGALKLFRFKSRPFVWWVFFSLVLALLPAALARGYDSFRILMFFFPALILMVSGLQAVLERAAGGKKIGLAVLLLGASICLDSYHLFNRFPNVWGTPGNAWNFGKEYELWKSYEILKGTNVEMGPGALLFDLRAHLDDVTPEVAAYSFDAAINPFLPFADAKWVAVLVDGNYRPFLTQRFPDGRFYWLGPREPYGRWMLGVLPVNAGNRAVLEKWYTVNQQMRPATELIIDAMPGASRKKIVDQILRCRGLAAPDPFLESCLWEKVFDNRVLERDALGCLEAVRHCVSEGYPLPEMYNEEGVILTQMGRYGEARKFFEKALKADVLQLTPAKENIRALTEAGK